MSGLQVAGVALAALNLAVVLLRLDGMTHRTHRWPPMLRLMVAGLSAAGCGWAAWEGRAVDAALALQMVVLGDLLYTMEIPDDQAWRPSKLRELRVRDHAQ